MAITKSEATSLVKKCTDNAMSIQGKMNTTVMKLNEIQDSGKKIVNEISDGIVASEIISGSASILSGNVGRIVSDCNVLINNYLKQLSTDVNNYIEKIEVMYNQTLNEGETPIYFNRITLQGNGNFAYSEGEANTSNRVSGTGSSDTQSSSGVTTKSSADQSGFINDSSSNKDPLYENLNYILNVNSTSSIDSSKFNNWNLFIKEFLKRNNFEKYVASIILKDKRVICRMTSGREYYFDNINSSVELINTIKGVI